MQNIVDTAKPEQRFTRRGDEIAGAGEIEYGRFRDLETRFGISRSKAYELIAEGKIRSVCIKRKGALTGVRLIDLSSVRRFCDSCDGNVEPQLSEQRRRARAVGVEKARAQVRTVGGDDSF
jgi:hypothetical protein